MRTLDVIVRFHDILRLEELNRCVYSLVTQEYAPLVINLVTQRFTDAELQKTKSVLSPLMRLAPDTALQILNYTHEQPVDARSALLNLGISNSKGRYLAFLDHDDTIYPEAYCQLVEQLSKTAAAITFATVSVKTREVFEDLLIVKSKKYPYKRSRVTDLFQENFCPPNSYLIDRSKIDPRDLHFHPDWSRLEDYHFLIRICAKYPSDFQLIRNIVGDYYIKNDGSNTTLTRFNQSDQAMAEWARAREGIEELKAATPVSEAVQHQLGLRVGRSLSVADLLKIASEDGSLHYWRNAMRLSRLFVSRK